MNGTVYTKGAAITSPEDMKGKKIRVMQYDTMIKMLDCMGGTGVPMGQGDFYSAIQQGVLDGAENNEASYANSKHYEIAPYYSYTKHLTVPDFLIVGTDVYNSLSDEDKQAFNEAAQEAAEYEYELWDDYTAEALKTVEDGGATIITDVDTESMKEAVKPVQENMTQNAEVKKIYDAVQASKQENSNE